MRQSVRPQWAMRSSLHYTDARRIGADVILAPVVRAIGADDPQAMRRDYRSCK